MCCWIPSINMNVMIFAILNLLSFFYLELQKIHKNERQGPSYWDWFQYELGDNLCLIYSCLLVYNLLSALSEDSCLFTWLNLDTSFFPSLWVFGSQIIFLVVVLVNHFPTVLYFKSSCKVVVCVSGNVDSASRSTTGLLCDLRIVILFSSVKWEYGPPFFWGHKWSPLGKL